MSSDWGNEWTEWQWQLPTRLTRENPPCPEGFHLLGTSEVQKKTKSQVLGIFPWPLRCGNDQIWLSDAHWGSLCAQPSSRHRVRMGDMLRVCAHPGSLQPGQEPKASTWTMKSQHDRIMKLVQIERSDGVDVKAAFSWLVQLLLAELHLPTDLSLNFCGENPGINLISSPGMKFPKNWWDCI